MKFVNASGSEYTPTNWLTFNDVLLKPQKSKFNSRNDNRISLASSLGGDSVINAPIVSANMDTVTGKDMAIAMNNIGGIGILHRFYPSLDEYSKIIKDVYDSCGKVAFSVGCGDNWTSFVNAIVDSLNPSTKNSIFVCLDVAHGHMEQSIESVKKLSSIKHIFVIAGNVATEEGAIELAQSGASCCKVGIGPGSICSTRVVTGHGVPQLSAIMNIRKALDSNGFSHIGVIADGGIKSSGDIVKALAAGANCVMVGSLLSGCDETPGDFILTKDKPAYKLYRGQSSRHFLNDIGKSGVASEGESLEVKAKGPVSNVVSELLGGIRSGLTYSGVGSIEELKNNSVFMEISQHGWVESTPHALSR